VRASSAHGLGLMGTFCAYGVAIVPPKRNPTSRHLDVSFWTPRCEHCGAVGLGLHHLRVTVPAHDFTVSQGVGTVILDSLTMVRLPATGAGEPSTIIPSNTVAAGSRMPVRNSFAFAVCRLAALVPCCAKPRHLDHAVREPAIGHLRTVSPITACGTVRLTGSLLHRSS
jgi:hypothetical protein